MKRTLEITMACIVILVTLTSQTKAEFIVDFSGGSTALGGGDFTVGFTFSVTDPLVVDGLAWWDEGGDGLNSSHEVGLWTSGGTLLASTVVSNGSTAEPSTSGFGNWLVEDIAQLNLGVGDYVVGGVQGNSIGGDLFRFSATATPTSGIVFGTAIQSTSTNLTLAIPTQPATSGINDGVWGPNVRTASSSAVPEPSSVAIFGIGAAAIGFVVYRRKKQTVETEA